MTVWHFEFEEDGYRLFTTFKDGTDDPNASWQKYLYLLKISGAKHGELRLTRAKRIDPADDAKESN